MSATRSFFIGKVPIGGGAPVSVQSMTNTDSRDAEATLAQIRELAQAGCDIVRLSVYDDDCLKALPTIVDGAPVPPNEPDSMVAMPSPRKARPT